MIISLIFAVADLFEKRNKRTVVLEAFPVVPSSVAASTTFFPSTKGEHQLHVSVRIKTRLYGRKRVILLWASKIDEIH